MKSLGLGEAIQQPSPIAETTLSENDEENPLETPPSGDTADPDANAITAGPSGETESLGGDVIESNNQNNRETASEPGDLNSSGQNNQAFETEENVVVVDETNAVNVKRKCYCKNILIVSASNYWHLMVIFREQERRSFFRSSSRNANSR